MYKLGSFDPNAVQPTFEVKSSIFVSFKKAIYVWKIFINTYRMIPNIRAPNLGGWVHFPPIIECKVVTSYYSKN